LVREKKREISALFEISSKLQSSNDDSLLLELVDWLEISEVFKGAETSSEKKSQILHKIFVNSNEPRVQILQKFACHIADLSASFFHNMNCFLKNILCEDSADIWELLEVFLSDYFKHFE
jgi:hypothetical protein